MPYVYLLFTSRVSYFIIFSVYCFPIEQAGLIVIRSNVLSNYTNFLSLCSSCLLTYCAHAERVGDLAFCTHTFFSIMQQNLPFFLHQPLVSLCLLHICFFLSVKACYYPLRICLY